MPLFAFAVPAAVGARSWTRGPQRCTSRVRDQYHVIRAQVLPEPDTGDGDDLLSRLARVPPEVVPGPVEDNESPAARFGKETTGLVYLFQKFPREVSLDTERYLSNPVRLLTASSISILFGFFSATSASTIIGSVADWDPLAAAVLLVWCESFTKLFYAKKNRSRVWQLVNAFKVGLIYGMTVDAFKLST